LRGIADELAKGHFRNVPFAVFDEAVEDFLDGKHEGGEHHTLSSDNPVHQITHMVVVRYGKGRVQPCGAAAFHDFRFAIGA
jgi:hypothetical protein